MMKRCPLRINKLRKELQVMKTRRVNITRRSYKTVAFLSFSILLLAVLLPQVSIADTAKEIDVSVDVALENFYTQVKGGKEFLASSKGVLVFPKVFKAGVGVGGEYGEGALRIGGKTVDYYNTVAVSFGLQLGAQQKTIIIIFMQEDALKNFSERSGWKAGVDGSIALIKLGADVALDTTNIKDPIIAFVFGQKGLMYNLTLEGSKFTKLDK
jgi:lipid-binding SYLF domain-containing protein